MEGKTIGFIGVGIMGKPMAANLLKAGYQVTVHDVNPDPVQELVAQGAGSADSAKAVTERSDIVITMLPDSPDVEDVVLGAGGVIEAAQGGLILIDMSSINPLVAQKIEKAVAEKGVRMLDCPVSGGEPGAISGSLAIMCGGDAALFEECKDLLLVMGKSAVHVGPIGAGNFTKLANQIIVAINIEAVGEALVLAQKAGLDPARVFDAIKGGLAGSSVLNAKAPMVMERNFKPGFKIKLHQKDLNNALMTAKDLDVPLPMTGIVQQFLSALMVDGRGDDDHGSIMRVIEKMANTEIRKAEGGA
jgi:2-hydroxy-3-oxopropionate reductase